LKSAKNILRDLTVGQPKLEGWPDVDFLLHDLKEKRTELQKIEDKRSDETIPLQLKIDQLNAEAKAKAEPIELQVKNLLTVVEGFVRDHEKDLDGRSKKLDFGVVGLRKKTVWLWPKGKTLEGLLSKFLRSKTLSRFVKVTNTLRREAIQAEGADLAAKKLGIYTQEDHEFVYELS
jgi:hypothetical protein